MFSWWNQKKEDTYKKTDNLDTQDTSIEFGYNKQESDDDNSSDSDDFDLFLVNKVKNLKTKNGYCSHIHHIDLTNVFFSNNSKTIYNDYFKGKKIPLWIRNIIRCENKLNGSDEIDVSKISCGLNNLEYTIVDDSSFIINKDIYFTIKYNFCIMGIYTLDSSSIRKDVKYNIIKKLNREKMTCLCHNLDYLLSGNITQNHTEYLLITTNTDYLKSYQSISYEIPYEFMLFMLLNQNTIKLDHKSKWVYVLLSQLEYNTIKSKINTS